METITDDIYINVFTLVKINGKREIVSKESTKSKNLLNVMSKQFGLHWSMTVHRCNVKRYLGNKKSRIKHDHNEKQVKHKETEQVEKDGGK